MKDFLGFGEKLLWPAEMALTFGTTPFILTSNSIKFRRSYFRKWYPKEEYVDYPREIVSITEDLVSLNLAVFKSLITLRDDGDFLLICEFRWNNYVLRGFLENLSRPVYLEIKQVLLQAGLITEAGFRDACKNYVDICFKNQIGWNLLHGALLAIYLVIALFGSTLWFSIVWFEGVIIVLSTVYFLISLNLRPVQTYESRLQAGSVSDVPGYMSILAFLGIMWYGLIMLSWIVALIAGIFILGMAIFLIRETRRKDGKSDEKYREKAEEMEKKTWELLTKK